MYETRGFTGFTGMNCLTAFTVGAIAGTAIALLTAPRTGRESRDALGFWSRRVKEKASRLPRAVREAVDQGREAGRRAFDDPYPERH